MRVKLDFKNNFIGIQDNYLGITKYTSVYCSKKNVNMSQTKSLSVVKAPDMCIYCGHTYTEVNYCPNCIIPKLNVQLNYIQYFPYINRTFNVNNKIFNPKEKFIIQCEKKL